MSIVSQVISIVLYPLFVPTYGMALFCCAFRSYGLPLPWVWFLFAVVGTFFFTCLVPLTAIWILYRKGEIKDLYITNARERAIPYIYSACAFGFWTYYLVAVLHAPYFINFVAGGAAVAIILVAWINRRWKISAHMTGWGGLLGGILSYAIAMGQMPAWPLLAGVLLLTIVLMVSRLYLDAHTPEQIALGWLLGLLCTSLPNMVLIYV